MFYVKRISYSDHRVTSFRLAYTFFFFFSFPLKLLKFELIKFFKKIKFKFYYKKIDLKKIGEEMLVSLGQRGQTLVHYTKKKIDFKKLEVEVWACPCLHMTLRFSNIWA